MKKNILFTLFTSILLSACNDSNGERLGSVNTKFRMIGASDRIELETFDDKNVKGIQCYITHAKTGGAKEWVNLEEDVSDSSLSCVQTAPIEFNAETIAKPRIVYKRDASLAFKSLQVQAYYDDKRQALVYMAYSDKILEGSPKNAVSAVSCLNGISEAKEIKKEIHPTLAGFETIKVGNCTVHKKVK